MKKGTRRPRGEGSITQLPNGKYKMTITIGVGVDGKQKRRTITGKTKKELLDKVSQVRLSVGKQTNAKNIYFKDLVRLFLNEKEQVVSSNTFKAYKAYQGTLLVPFYDYKVRNITGYMIDELLDSVRKKDGDRPSKKTMQVMKAQLSAIFNYAVKHEFIDKSPMVQTKARPSARRKADTIQVPTETQIKAILQDAKKKDEHGRTYPLLYPLFLLAVSTGMRIGELLGLRVSDVNTETNTIDINKQLTTEGDSQTLKTYSSSRIIYVQHDILMTVLESTKEQRDNHELSPEQKVFGTILYQTAANKIYRFMHTSPEVPKGFTFHMFRHFHATQLLLKGVNVKEVSKRLGHKDIGVTLNLYAHWIPEMDKKAANLMGSQFII